MVRPGLAAGCSGGVLGLSGPGICAHAGSASRLHTAKAIALRLRDPRLAVTKPPATTTGIYRAAAGTCRRIILPSGSRAARAKKCRWLQQYRSIPRRNAPNEPNAGRKTETFGAWGIIRMRIFVRARLLAPFLLALVGVGTLWAAQMPFRE